MEEAAGNPKLEELKKLADTLPKAVKANASALVELMGQKIEGIGDQAVEWRPPTARVVQPSSDRSKLPKGTPIGAIMLGEHVAEQPIKVVPIRMWDSRQMWSPDKDEARLLCSSPDGVLGYIGKYCKECEFAKFDKETNRSACNKTKTVLAITADLSKVFVVNFTKTNYANGREWADLMKKALVAPFKRQYSLKTETNAKFKNVESLKVETNNESTPTEHLPFLDVLFAKIGEDRDAYRKKFYEIVTARKQDQNLLTDSSSGQESLPAPEAVPSSEQATMAKKYSL
jgi:hypothetical protein